MPRGPRKVGTREETELTRATILRTGEQLFMQYGYRAVSTRQIAEACGLTQPALYHYFSDKQDLYAEVICENIAQTQAALERIVRRNEVIEERLRMVVRYLFTGTQHDIGLMLHDIQYELDPAVRNRLGKLFQQGLIAPIASIFEQGLQEGLLRDVPHGGMTAVAAAYLFMSMLSRFLMRSQYAQAELSSVSNTLASDISAAEMIVEILLYGLTVQRATGL